VPTLVANSSPLTGNATRFRLEIGGFSLGAWCEGGMPIALDSEHQPFVLTTAGKAACDIELEVSWADQLKSPPAPPAFASGGLWSAFKESTGTKFYFSSSALGAAPYKAAWFDQSFSRGHVVLNRFSFPLGGMVFPLEYPIDELVMMHRLSLGEGVELHALGLADQDGRGYLFLGHSGAGKSTTARLWMGKPGVRLLSDDRIIVRKIDGQFWMFGTPWHGDAGVASPARAALSKIFFLQQAPSNELLAMRPAKAAAELFARSFVPHYLDQSLQFTLDFLDELTRNVPCAFFRFTPTENAVEAIRHARA
jgi:hypothetical protein